MEDVEIKKHQLPIFTLKSQDKLINKKKHTRLFETPPDLGKVFFKRFPWL